MRIDRRRSSIPEIPLVSTSDVSFLLLIFFLSTAALSVERGLLLDLPREGESPAVMPAARIVSVSIAADGAFDLEGTRLSPAALRAALAARIHTDAGAVVRLRVDPAAPYAAFVVALDQVKLSGARQLSLESGARP